jgi:hypothetical protein
MPTRTSGELTVTRKSAAVFVVTTLALLALVLVPATLAAKGGQAGGKPGGGGGGGGDTTGSFSLVLHDSNSNGVPNFGESVTFNVTSTAAYPMVTLTCYQDRSVGWVTNQTVGFYPGWVWSQDFPLSSWKWTSGAADCDAVLYYQTRKGNQTLDAMTFHVDA